MNEIKNFNVKLPKEIWLFLKKKAAEDETSMNALILKEMIKLKNKSEKNS